MKIWYQVRFTKLTETRTYSVESITQLLYIIATNFDSKKFGNLEEGESANDLRNCETIFKRISPTEKLPHFSNRENTIAQK